MEIPIIAGMIGLGYYYNKNKDYLIKNTNEPKNIYESRRSINIRRDELKHAGRNWNEPNKIFPGPPKIDPKILFNKVDYDNNKLPIEFNNYDKNDLFTEVKTKNVENKPLNIYNTNSPITSGWHGISLTGEPIDPNNFKHNNPVPFFGGTVKQNVDDKANQTLMENFTGNIDNYQEKKELGAFFPAEANICNPYGMANHTSFLQDRIIPPKVMNNITPVERVRVGPGLNQGYTAQPSGGFQQANARDYVLPKNVDELRAKNNPKLTYMGRILSGKGISKRGKLGIVEKRKPDSFFINTPDRYFTSVGAQTGERQRPNIILRNVNRKYTGKNKIIGGAAPLNGNKCLVKGEYNKSRKNQYKTDGPRHLNATNKWGIDECANALHDYGKGRIGLKETERRKTSKNDHIGFVKSEGRVEARNCQEAKQTKKNITSINNHKGNMHNQKQLGPVCNPDDKTRTTIKEQTLDKGREGMMAPQYPSNLPACDPNDKMKTTMKEQTIDNNHEGFMDPQKPANVPVYDPNDIPRTTIKEQNIDNSHEGFVSSDYQKSYVCDPENVAKTTIKETTVDNNRIGTAQGPTKPTVCDPNNKAKTTMKETTLLENAVGGMYNKKGMGYNITKNEIKNTVRQFTSDTQYGGIAGATSNKKPQSYYDIYNSTVRSIREQVAKGRTPTPSGPKKLNSDLNMTTKKITDIQNNYLNERGLAPNKVYNSLPQTNMCGVTKNKFDISNECLQDRLDPGLLNQLNDNPYTMRSLHVKN